MRPDNEEGRPGGSGLPDEHAGGRVVAAMVRRGRRDWRAVWEPMRAQARAAAEARRSRVLAHPDLAEALTERPIGYARPEQWNGYVPPALWREELNTSPHRAGLVEICAEALRREQGGES